MFVGKSTDVAAVYEQTGEPHTFSTFAYPATLGKGFSGSFTFTAPPGAEACAIHFRWRIRGVNPSPNSELWVWLPGVTPTVDPVWGDPNAVGFGGPSSSLGWAGSYFGDVLLYGPASALPFTIHYQAPTNGLKWTDQSADPLNSIQGVVAAMCVGFAAPPDDPSTISVSPSLMRSPGGSLIVVGSGSSQLANDDWTIPSSDVGFERAVFTWSHRPSPNPAVNQSDYLGPFTGQTPPPPSTPNGWTQRATSTNWPPVSMVHRTDVIGDPNTGLPLYPLAVHDQGQVAWWRSRQIAVVGTPPGGPEVPPEEPDPVIRPGRLLGLARGRRAIHT